MSIQTRVKRLIRKGSDKIFGPKPDRTEEKIKENELLADNVAYRISLETMLTVHTIGKSPTELFYGISDNFWYWLITEGSRKNAVLRNLLPGVADEATQLRFTGKTGDVTFGEGFYYYTLFKKYYEKYHGNISEAKILDYGCGWGRIIRFFIKDIPAVNLWGCDPVPEMIELCKKQNKWANFESIDTNPPTPFEDNTFDMIYSFSVFSHLSEDFHLKALHEINRILKPGGLYMTTTRNRNFITECKEFPDVNKSLADYDKGLYCHHNFGDKTWPYWGESAISKQYVQEQWTKEFNFLEYFESHLQNLIVIQKPF